MILFGGAWVFIDYIFFKVSEDGVGEGNEHIFEFVFVPFFCRVYLLGQVAVGNFGTDFHHIFFEQVIVFLIVSLDAYFIIELFGGLLANGQSWFWAFSFPCEELDFFFSEGPECYFKGDVGGVSIVCDFELFETSCDFFEYFCCVSEQFVECKITTDI